MHGAQRLICFKNLYISRSNSITGYFTTKFRYFFRVGVKACVQHRVCPCGVILPHILPRTLWFSSTEDLSNSIPRISIIVIINPLTTGWYDGVIWRHSSQELSPICCYQYSQTATLSRKTMEFAQHLTLTVPINISSRVKWPDSETDSQFETCSKH